MPCKHLTLNDRYVIGLHTMFIAFFQDTLDTPILIYYEEK